MNQTQHEIICKQQGEILQLTKDRDDALGCLRHMEEALEACEKASGFVPCDTSLSMHIAQIVKEREELRKAITSPEAVWVNMLRGTIARPRALDHYEECKARCESLEKERDEAKTWSEELAKMVCEMEDALGFRHDQHDKDGAFVPTMGPWKERVRDLIAAEGERDELLLNSKGYVPASELKQTKKVIRCAIGRLLNSRITKPALESELARLSQLIKEAK